MGRGVSSENVDNGCTRKEVNVYAILYNSLKLKMVNLILHIVYHNKSNKHKNKHLYFEIFRIFGKHK